MELSKFCPRCGKETDKLYGDEKKLCADCYPDKNTLLEIPDVVEIEICSVCGRMKKKGDWIEEYSMQDQMAAKFAEFSKEDQEMELQYWEENEKRLVIVHAIKGEIRDHYDTELRFKQEQCETCSKFSGGFYKVKMQVRGEGDLEPISNQIVDKAAELTNENRKEFLSNIERNEHGFNVFLSTDDMAKKILNELKGSYDPDVKRSYELMGEEDGQEVYRNVIAVRFG
jgi:nonsense-mediated mRNA decay protein 3